MLICKTPPKISFSNNQTLVEITSNEQQISAGTKAKIILYFGSVNFGLIDKSFKLSFGGNEYIFTSAISPDDSGLQYSAATANIDDNLSWMLRIRNDLYNNFYISQWYNLTYSYNEVILESKNSGTSFNISGVNVDVPGMSISATSGTDAVLNPFYRIYMQLISDGIIIGEDNVELDSANKAIFDIGEYFKPYIKGSFTYPESTSNLIVTRNECLLNYMVRYGAYYGDQPVIKKLSSTMPLLALYGGVSAQTEALYNENNTSWFSHLQSTHMWLTWHPGNKKTLPSYCQKLWYIVHTETALVKLMVKLKFWYEGQFHFVTVNKFTKNVSMYDMLEIASGYAMLNLVMDVGLQNPAWTLYSYDVFLLDHDDALISQMATYIMDFNDTGITHEFIFKNSFGVFETLHCKGLKTTEPEYARDTYSTPKKIKFSVTDAENRTKSILETKKYVLQTGIIMKKEWQWMSEFLLSKEVYEIIDGRKYPVRILSSKKNANEDKTFINNVTIEYELAWSNEHYSNDVTIVNNGNNGGINIINNNSQD